MSWNPTMAPVPCHDSVDAALAEATWKYFLNPAAQNLQQLVAPDFASPPREMLRAAVMIQGAHAAIDDESTIVARAIADSGHAVACRTGCCACCKQAVLANPFEAALIGIYLNNNPEQREEFVRAYARWNVETGGMRDDFLAWAERRYRDNADDGKYHYSDFHPDCPFLLDGLCRIYPVRPYACRSYLALSEECANPTTSGSRPGFQGMDVGSYTHYKKNYQPFLQSLWMRCGIDPKAVRNRFMPELVTIFLNEDVEGLLKFCHSEGRRIENPVC
ncbi:YkgJ family cysteine cluster protein [Desulfocurvibacter africanus]|uniref:YkgJ family cysteine cluster protein n=1 Tax=Desulfocurvibacter africanus TaxID=873 RepID=UPI0003FFF5E7|nr:YkgJ family cysteine cluster protein [Desulfocurvibacter africanus]